MPSFILIRPTVWPQSTKLQTGQRSDGIGRTVFGRPFVKGFALCYQSVCPVCDVGVLWPNGWTDRDITWRAGRPRHCVRWGPSSPLQRGTVPPQFLGPYLLRQNGCMIKMSLGMEPGLGPGDFVYMGTHADCSSPLRKGGVPLPNFRPIFIVAKRLNASRCHLVWNQGDFVLDGDSAPYPKRGEAPQFFAHVRLLWPNGCMDQDATWYGGRPTLCWMWSQLPPEKGHTQPHPIMAHVYCGHGRREPLVQTVAQLHNSRDSMHVCLTK